MATPLQQHYALAQAIFGWFDQEFGLGSTWNKRDVIELTKIIRGKTPNGRSTGERVVTVKTIERPKGLHLVKGGKERQ